MLSKATLKAIADILKVKETDLDAAIKSETESDITLPDGISVFSETELTTLKNNEYNAGKTKGVEIVVKEAKEKRGLDFTGKTIDGLLDAFQSKTLEDGKLKPDAKVTELEGQVKTLKATIAEQDGKLAEKDNEVNSVKINGELYKHIPALGEGAPSLGQDDIIQLMRSNGYEFKLESGKMVAYKGGQLQQDKLGTPLGAKDIVSGFMTEKKLIGSAEQVPGGRGAGNSVPSTKAMSLSELKKSFQDSGKSLLGVEFSQAVQAAAKDNADFDMNK